MTYEYFKIRNRLSGRVKGRKLHQEAPIDAELKEILQSAKSLAIVGVSNKPDRPSYQVAQWLLENSHLDIYFVNPVLADLLGKPVYPKLSDIPAPIDIVDVFRNIADVPEVLDQAIAINAKTFWLQLGLSSEEIGLRAKSAGLNIIMNRCSKIEYARLLK